MQSSSRKTVNLLLSILLCMTVLFAGCGGNSKAEESASPSVSAAAPASYPVTKAEGPVFGMWFSYIEYRDYCQNMDEAAFTQFVQQAVSNMKDLGINTVYVHAVAFTDAFYDSSIYPRTSILPDIDYDPLAIFTKAAKDNGMHIEAWINPMRSVKVEEADSLPSDFIVRKWIDENDERVRQVGDRYYLNPAYPEVKELIVSVVNEILDSYDVDGIHMDDYFYPSGTEDKFDAYIYSRALEDHPDLTREQFRENNVDEMIKEIHDAVKKKDQKLLFGISPSGNIQNNISLMYADASHWVQQGSVDYLEPQIYWGFEHPIKPFESTLKEWLDITTGSDVALIPGLAAYKSGWADYYASDEKSDEWEVNSDMLGRMTAMCRDYGCTGVVYYSYASLFHPDDLVKEIVEKEIVHIKSSISEWQSISQ